jgi:hypothetical protein
VGFSRQKQYIVRHYIRGIRRILYWRRARAEEKIVITWSTVLYQSLSISN